MSVALVAAWYLIGFGAAAIMIDRGSSRMPWWAAAALLGGVTAALAVGVSHVLRRTQPSPKVPSGSGTRALVVVGSTDRNEGVLRAAAGAAVGRRTVVCTMGAEAHRRWIDTGERSAARRAIDEAVRWLGPNVTVAVAPTRADVAAAEIASRAPLHVVVTGAAQLAPVTGTWIGHLAAARAGALSIAIDAPVLIAPDRPRLASPSREVTASGVA